MRGRKLSGSKRRMQAGIKYFREEEEEEEEEKEEEERDIERVYGVKEEVNDRVY